MWMQIKQSWSNLAQREKQLVTLLMVFLTFVLFYSLIWFPIQSENDRMKLAVEKSSNEWVWLNQQASLVTQQTVGSPRLDIQTKTELMRFVQDELKSENLMHQMQELQLTAKGVTVSFNEVNAPRFLRWLSKLESQGLIAKNIQLMPIKAGFAKARVEFEVVQ
ncbi:MAG: type II secretion system protein GspM [Thiomicrorhabdus sp.]|jgi:type II secretory pathway component PulM|nr:type II secretion system protein GspM [Thiomicrorhabdus sp.]